MSQLPISPPPAPRRRRFVRPAAFLAILGPGIIAANAGNDAGGIATYASAGSQFQYQTLFIGVLVIAALVAVQEMAARLGAYSGEGLMSLVREEFSLRIGAFAVVCLLVANLGLVVSEFAGIGAALEIFGVSRYISVPIAAASILGIVMFGSYRRAERLFLLLSLVFLAYPIAMILARPDWGDVARNTFIPHFDMTRDFLLIAVALVGTTITPYMQLYQAAAVADRGIGPDEYRHERIDAIVGSLFAGFVFLSVLIATGAAIGGSGLPLTSAEQAASALKPVAGAGAEYLFAAGLLGASMLAAAIVPLSTAYGLAEAVGAERSVSRKFREAPLFLGLFAAQVVIGAAVALIPVNLIDLLVGMQVLNGFITPVILGFLFVLTNRSSAVGEAVNGPKFRTFALLCVIVVSLLAVAALVVTIAQMFGA
ncbi:MAG: divalent metal cation transporter [Acidimicrobiia bacterium]|nr:divalent metal cation transporter [Acidimicrobiia bacterium]